MQLRPSLPRARALGITKKLALFSSLAGSLFLLAHTSGIADQDKGLRPELEHRLLLSGLRYAREHSHPVTGFVEDTVENYRPPEPKKISRASISSTGFMMALVADLYVKGIVSPDEAYTYCDRPLTAVIKKEEKDRAAAALRLKTGAPDPHTDISYRGWFAHFIDWETGDRWIDQATGKGVEYATTDSTWFLGGAIVCGSAFPHTPVEAMANRIFSEVDFHDFMTDGGQTPDKRTLSMSYNPDAAPAGYSPAQWQIYQHSWLVDLLGLAAPRPSFRLPLEAWVAWKRTGIELQSADPLLSGKVLYGNRRALFSHYFPDVFLDSRKIKEACGIDYFENSRLATRFNRDTALNDDSSKTFQAGLWGLDAGPNPNKKKLTLGSALSLGADDTVTYGVNTPYRRNGTACPACAVAAAMFEPELVFADLEKWSADPDFGRLLWGRYGPANGINLDYGWVAPYALSGIVGPMALSVANLDEATSVWRLFDRFVPVRRGLEAVRRAPLPADGCLLPE